MIAPLARLWRKDRLYRVGKYDLRINADHALPAYQRRFATYDRFLPHLARELEAGTTVIDIGANIGDSIAAMASANAQLRYIAVEPSGQFLPLLRHNCDVITDAAMAPEIEILEGFVSDKLAITGITARSGTAKAVISADAGESSGQINFTLDSVIAGAGSAVSLIKSDTDGFDWSVLNSGMAMIAGIMPMLFFECEAGKQGEHVGDYASLFDRLQQTGYQHFFVFDNFGAFVCETPDCTVLQGLLEYVAAQNRNSLHRTMYYFDVLAVSAAGRDAAKSAVAKHVASLHSA